MFFRLLIVSITLLVSMTASAVTLQQNALTCQRDGDQCFPIARAYVDAGQLQSAEKCLAESVKHFPEYLDLALYLARVRAWQGKIQKAWTGNANWRIGDHPGREHEIYELMGDLFWYEERFTEAAKHYKMSLKKKKSQEVAKKYKKAKLAKEEGGDPNFALQLEHARTFQTQNQTILENGVQAQYIGKQYFPGVGYRSIERKFSETEKLDDRMFQSSLLIKSFLGEFNFKYERTVKSEFLFRNAAQAGFQIPLPQPSENFSLSLGIDFRKTTYSDKSTGTWIYSIVSYVGSFLFTNRNYVGGFGSQGESSYLSTEYLEFFIRPQVWVAAGNAESSRPYLIPGKSSRFETYGLKLSSKTKWYVDFYAAFERRFERAFRQDFLLAGLSL